MVPPGAQKALSQEEENQPTLVRRKIFFEPKANIGVDTCGNERIRKKGDCGPS